MSLPTVRGSYTAPVLTISELSIPLFR